MNIINISSTVKMLLQKFPQCRDSDELLILKVWAEENPQLRCQGYCYADFARLWLDGKCSSTESIRRCRQKLQQEFPELRGVSYEVRQNKIQASVKEQLHMPEMAKGGIP